MSTCHVPCSLEEVFVSKVALHGKMQGIYQTKEESEGFIMVYFRQQGKGRVEQGKPVKLHFHTDLLVGVNRPKNEFVVRNY